MSCKMRIKYMTTWTSNWELTKNSPCLRHLMSMNITHQTCTLHFARVLFFQEVAHLSASMYFRTRLWRKNNRQMTGVINLLLSQLRLSVQLWIPKANKLKSNWTMKVLNSIHLSKTSYHRIPQNLNFNIHTVRVQISRFQAGAMIKT